MAKWIVMAMGGCALGLLVLTVWFAYQAEQNIPPRGEIIVEAANVGTLDASGR